MMFDRSGTPTGSRERLHGRNLLLMSATSALAMATATPAFAQIAPPATQQTTTLEDDVDQDIIVTGIRGSLQRNLDIKRESAGVVDVISAEDIGKFPDSNVASALQRLPGVAIQRSGSRGEATGVSIRGFGGDFVRTLNDGRQLSTATGSRGVDFTTVGADFVGRLSVYKTPDVALTASAIGGTIDISLPKPFDHNGFTLAATGQGSIQDRSKDVRATGGLLVSNTFADDTIGVLGDLSYSRRDTTSNHVFVPGWVGARFYQCQVKAACAPSELTPANKTLLGWFPQQTGAEQTNNQDERIDGRIAIQWKPTDGMLLTIDDNFSKQVVHSSAYGYGAWFNGDDLRNVKLDSNGTAVDFNQFGTPMDFNANHSRNTYQTNQVGANLKWDVVDHLTLDLDAAVSYSVRNPGDNGYGDSMDIGYGGTNRNDATGTFVSTPCTFPVGATPTTAPTSCAQYGTVLGANTGVALGGNSSDNLPQIHDIGPAGNVARFTDAAVIGSHVIGRGAPYNTDNVKQFRGSLSWNKDGFRAQLGGQYIQDTLYQRSTNTFTNGVFASRSGYGTPSGRGGGSTGGIAPLPASVYQGQIGTSDFIPGYSGNVAPAIIVFDPYGIYKLLEQTGGSVKPTLDPGSVLEVREKTFAGFFKTSFENEIAGLPFFVSAGVRYEKTNIRTSAIGRDPVSLSIPAGDPTLLDPTYTAQQSIQRESSYQYLLPAFDAKLEVTPSLILRADASRTLTRPALGDLRPTVNLGTLRRGSLAASGGNPDLLPYLSDNFDAAAEWYYSRNSYFAVNFYLKHISNFVVGGVTTRSINGVIDPNTKALAQFQVNAKINGPEATVKGIELALQHVFGDSGFGFNANATFPTTDKKFDSGDISGTGFSITGLAKSANFVGFFEKYGFQIRGAVNWRDSYLAGLGQGQGGTFGAEPVYVDKQLQVDANASYDFSKQLTVFVEGSNLNNSTYSTHGRFSNQALDIWSYGRRFTFGARFRY